MERHGFWFVWDVAPKGATPARERGPTSQKRRAAVGVPVAKPGSSGAHLQRKMTEINAGPRSPGVWPRSQSRRPLPAGPQLDRSLGRWSRFAPTLLARGALPFSLFANRP